MNVIIKGGSTRQKELAQDIIKFSGKKLLSHQMYPYINVTCKIRRNMFDEISAYGLCLISNENKTKKLRNFIIYVDANLRQRMLLQTIAHEMVHIKQWATGQLNDINSKDKKVWFDGMPYDDEKLDYFDLPWEIEAHGREMGLFVRWAESRGFMGKKWTRD